MSLQIGQQLGSYEITALLGKGGMGEVYRARDPKLKRDVAIKILPEEFSSDADRIARFQREAEALGALNHQNIAAIYDLQEANSTRFLILELVEGATLADVLATRGSLPVDEAVQIAKQICEALEAAHERGVIHRDLKPANVKLTADARVKVLDFGLAKAIEGASSRPTLSNSPTLMLASTPGLIVGTPAYMSPEQARGRSADQRSDVFSFGCVLYEMLTGKRVFDGDEISDTLANILKAEPDWNALPADTPASVRRVLRRCLEKDPKRRTHDIADARIDLDESDPAIAAAPPPAKPRFLNLERAVWALLVGLLAGGFAYSLLRQPPPSPVVRFQIDPPADSFFGSNSGIGRADGTSNGSISPDGTQLAFVATQKPDRTQLWVRRFDASTARPLPGTENAMMPFWSPDSRWLGFFAGGKVKRIDTVDGSVQTIADAEGIPRGGSWGSRDVIVYAAGNPTRLAHVSARGGEVTILAANWIGRWPSFLPDGRHFLYSGRTPEVDGASILIGSIEPASETRTLVAGDNATFVPPNLLLFVRGERLLQQRFDPDRRETSGEATTVVEQILYNAGSGRADLSVSSGVLAYRSGFTRNSQFAWFDRAGNLLENVGPAGNFRTPDMSPDGQRLAYGDVNRRDIWLFDLARQTPSRFTSGPGTETSPVWFPDGRKIIYRTLDGMFEKDVTGTGAERLVLKQPVNGPCQVSADGKWILYFAVGPNGTMDVYVLPTTGDGKPQPIVESRFPDVEPQFSPDVHWLAYASSENGRNEVYVQAFPSTGRRWQVSRDGGRQPLWRADGKELFFVSEDRKFYAVDVSEKNGSFEFGVPKFLFEMRANVFNSRNSYLPSRDGKRFLVNVLLDADDAPISIVQSWQHSP